MDEQYMKQAIQLAAQAIGQTYPNPMVGCVIVNGGEIVGMGAHLRAGEPHAEVHALRMAGEKSRGATAYVTLEPCNHFGKTPPCTNALMDAGVKRVVVAVTDQNPLVNGMGLERLRQNGIEVVTGVCEHEATQLNIPFFHRIVTGKPYVTLKTAMSIDGKMGTMCGDSKWITNEESRRDVHAERAKRDAILVGVGTVLADDPQLTVRLDGVDQAKTKVILDTHLRTPIHSRIFEKGRTIIVTGNNICHNKRALYENEKVAIAQMNTSHLEIEDVLRYLGEKGITSLYVEGGSTVHSSFLASGLWNELHAYIAPKLISGTRSFFSSNVFEKMQDTKTVSLSSIQQFGDDVKLIYKVEEE